MKPKVILIGLDGATWTLLRAFAEDGTMPTIKYFIENGVTGTLLSTIPCYTAPAWTSMVTGLNPGKHGIYGFLRENKIASISYLSCPKIWNILNEHGMSTGIMNVPLTYPPEKIDGFMVPGMLTPNRDDTVWPKNVLKEIEAECGEYIFDIPVDMSKDIKNTSIFNRLRDSLWARHKAFSFLMDKYKPDFSMIVFELPDRIQHLFWKYLNPTTYLYNATFAENVRINAKRLYADLDKVIARLLEKYGNNSYFFLASDHGFTDLNYTLYLNNLFIKKGILQLECFARQIQLVNRALLSFKNRIKLLPENFLKSSYQPYDLRKTIAYASPPFECGVYINQNGIFINREEVKGRVIKALKELKHPLTDDFLNLDIVFKENIYSGPYMELGPDILITIENNTFSISNGLYRRSIFYNREKYPWGIHHKNGIWGAIGPGIKQEYNIWEINITDIFPTILSLYNIPIPSNCDGRVLNECFISELPTSIDDQKTFDHEGQNKQAPYSRNETIEIKRDLRNLGYIE